MSQSSIYLNSKGENKKRKKKNKKHSNGIKKRKMPPKGVKRNRESKEDCGRNQKRIISSSAIPPAISVEKRGKTMNAATENFP